MMLRTFGAWPTRSVMKLRASEATDGHGLRVGRAHSFAAEPTCPGHELLVERTVGRRAAFVDEDYRVTGLTPHSRRMA
jgi:NAD/NADP transhydrogenase alpha subunit